MNSVFISGGLIAAPVFRPVGSHKVCILKLAVKDRWSGTFIFVDVEAWDKHAEIIEDLEITKGDTVNVEGHLKMDTWNDKDTGLERSKLYISASSVYALAKFPKKHWENEEHTEDKQPEKKAAPPPPQATPQPPQKPESPAEPPSPRTEPKAPKKHRQKDFSKRRI